MLAFGSQSKAEPSPSVARLRSLVREQHDLVWRSLRRLGVPDKDIEDAVQRVFIVVGSKLDDIVPAQERSYVFGVALRVASDVRRGQRRRPEQLVSDQVEGIDESPGPDALLQRGEMLRLLGSILEQLPNEQRSVLMLHEFEEMSLTEIAHMLDIPVGTVASRLRRGRNAFSELVSRYRQRCELEES
jgi:RNA polymerase sigma-70 factor (ECF subfamily)